MDHNEIVFQLQEHGLWDESHKDSDLVAIKFFQIYSQKSIRE